MRRREEKKYHFKYMKMDAPKYLVPGPGLERVRVRVQRASFPGPQSL